MRRALILNAIHPQIGGVLIRGERGTAKSTAARALAALLPEIEAVADCPFGCDPDQPATWCTECRERAEAGEELPRAHRRTRFVDLPVSATEDRVVGTLDIERAIQKGERRFEPGVLAAANRGVLSTSTRLCCAASKANSPSTALSSTWPPPARTGASWR